MNTIVRLTLYSDRLEEIEVTLGAPERDKLHLIRQCKSAKLSWLYNELGNVAADATNMEAYTVNYTVVIASIVIKRYPQTNSMRH